MKYILYCTKNNINSKIYIGVHKTLTPYKFDGYLGCGCYENGTGNKFKTPFQNALRKYGYKNFTRTTLMVFDTEQEAYGMEATIVTHQFVKRLDTYNIGIGGIRDISDRPVSMFNLLGVHIKSFDSIYDAAKSLDVSPVSVNTTCKLTNRSCRGYYFRYGITNKISLPKSHISLKREGIPIVQYSLAGYRMKTWKSAKEISVFYHYDKSTITAACRGKKKTANGYQWRYLSDGVNVLPSINTAGGKKVAVFITDKDGVLVNSFKSVTEATDKTGVGLPTIYKAFKDGKMHSGYFWHRQEVDDMI